jgi:hypothetical protein
MSDVRSDASGGSGKIETDAAKAKAAMDDTGEGSETFSANWDPRKDRGIDSMFDQLAIAEEEFDDFVVEEDDEALAESTR